MERKLTIAAFLSGAFFAYGVHFAAAHQWRFAMFCSCLFLFYAVDAFAPLKVPS